MHRIVITAASIAVGAAAFVATPAAARCTLKGTWSESVYGGTITLTTNKAGTASVPAICSENYTATVTAWGAPGFNVHGGVKGKSCPAWFTTLKFQPGSCTVAKGTLYRNTGKLPDTWTKTAEIAHRSSSRNTALSTGMK